MIILNEKEYAESLLAGETKIDKNPFQIITILAKYYYHHMGYRKKKITALLIEFLKNRYPLYEDNKYRWELTVDKIASKAGKYKLFEIDEIWITKSELEKIQNLHNSDQERLAFTLLCLAKLANTKNQQNCGWVSNGRKEIFDLARINTNVSGRNVKIGKLRDSGLIDFPKKIGNLKCRVTFIDDGEKVLSVNDFRELGYEYLKYKGENYIRCGECGVLTKGNKNGTKKYCSSCAKYTPKAKKMVTCIDCGYEFEVEGNNKRTNRCDACYSTHRREQIRMNVQKSRDNNM